MHFLDKFDKGQRVNTASCHFFEDIAYSYFHP